MKFKFELGETLKDKITGFKGVVMARAEYFTGCIHYGLCSQSLHDGKPIDWEWIDESQLVKVRGAKSITGESKASTSGPFQNPSQV